GDDVPDDCQLKGNDCDLDGIPDDCQIAANDCNENGILDRCEISSGAAQDCNTDGTIDACQLGSDFAYRIDDGGAEFGIRSAGSHMAWLSSYRIERGASRIEAIEINFVFMPAGATATVGLWSDPNGDGNPSDAQLLASAVVPTGPLGVFKTVDIPDTEVGPDGTSFFVGAYAPVGGNDFPGALDTSGNPILGRCWVIGRDTPFDPNNLAAGAAQFETIESALFPGKWLVRGLSTTTEDDCNGNGVLDECDIDAGTSADVDNSGRPDECEDCNENGVLDSSDIAFGTSADCNGDLVPDECQLLGFDCNANGVPDGCELEGADCNANGVPDSCDIASGTSDDIDASGKPDECEDCNTNGVLDSADIAGGTSLDCNSDLVPDECQLGEPPLDVEYFRDDGTREGNYGAGGVVDILWLNQYNAEQGGETISRISVVLGNAFAGVPYRVALWNDPNGDGEPSDAQVIATADAVAANGNTSIFNDIDIAPTYIGPAGTSFFAGVIFRDTFGNQFPLGVDTNSNPNQRTWVSIGDPIDPNNLSNAAIYGYLINDNGLVRAYGFNGTLPDDCNANGVPDECDIADGTEIDGNANGIPDCCESGNGCGACAGDLDGNGTIEAPDLALLLGAWGTAGGDINGDGSTNAQDLSLLLGAWGVCR
ncbi:MAG: hypothetical protein LW636_12420, partial [Planctomycetaceae bacterium]|nr:hypothetical protein [Planctomycetaceae bacterium]